MGFPRQECWNRLPFPSPGDLPDPGIKPGSPTLQAVALLFELLGKLPGVFFYLFVLFFAKTPIYPGSSLTSSEQSFRVI